MVLGLDISPGSPIGIALLPKSSVRSISLCTTSFKTKCQISSPTCSLAPVFGLLHRCILFTNSTLQLRISARNSFWAPYEKSSDLFPAHVPSHLPHRIWPCKDSAALGAMNHHFILLSHMWVKLFDINHTLAAPVWNRRAICPPPVAGCSLCLYPERLF